MRMLLHACCGPCSLEPSRILREQGHDLTIFYANSNIAPANEYEHRLETLRTWAGSEGIAVQEGSYDQQQWEKTAGRIGSAAVEEARQKLLAHKSEEVGAAAGAGGFTAGAGGFTAGAGGLAAVTGQAQAGADDAKEEAASAAANASLRFGTHSELTLEEAVALAVDPGKRAARCRACYRLRLQEAARRAAEQGFEALSTTLAVSPYQYSDIIQEELERAAVEAGVKAVFEDFRPFYPEATRRSRDLGMYRQNYCGCLLSYTEAAAERAERKAERKALHAAERAAHASEHAAEAAALAARKAERANYDAKQARKRAILKALRDQRKQS